jgi:hypothetical protein
VPAAAIVWLVFAIAWVVVLALAAKPALLAFREAKRLRDRVGAYRQLPVVAALERCAEDARRLEGTASLIEPLLERAQAAIAVIRQGPLPPEVVSAYVRVRDEVAAFRRLRIG